MSVRAGRPHAHPPVHKQDLDLFRFNLQRKVKVPKVQGIPARFKEFPPGRLNLSRGTG